MQANEVHLLVVAKAPVPGQAKTRLGANVGMERAADLAAAALLDTLDAGAAAFPLGQRHCALAGDLAAAARGAEIRDLLTGWEVRPQRGAGFAERLVAAHGEVAAAGGSVVQIGMDTPQVTPADLVAASVALGDHDAALGPAADGGWWALALRDPTDAVALATVAMSTPTTGRDTHAALTERGLTVGALPVLRDVDTVADAEVVSSVCGTGRFASAWSGA